MTAQKKPLIFDEAFTAMTPRARGRLVVRYLATLLLEAAGDSDDPLLTVDQAADLAGIGRQSIRNWCKWHHIGAMDKERRRFMVSKTKLRAYLIKTRGSCRF
jgi:hypothetical protein